MSYTPPSSTDIDFELDEYSPPSKDSVDFQLSDSIVKIYDGSSFVERPLKYYDGSSWILPANVKYYDGSQWIQVYQ